MQCKQKWDEFLSIYDTWKLEGKMQTHVAVVFDGEKS